MTPPASDTVERRILAALDAAGVPYRVLDHEPAYDAHQAAALRGTPLSMGAKALVMRLDRGLGLVVLALPADRPVDNRALRHHLRVRRYRFATEDELRAATGLSPGSVPPFGRPVLDLPLYADVALVGLPEIAFTPGVHDRSIVLATADWRSVARPEVFAFSGPPAG